MSHNISFSVSGSANAGSTATVSWSTTTGGTKYINSTGVNLYPRVTPKSGSRGVGTLIGGSYVESFQATFQEPRNNSGVAVGSHSVNYTLRTGSSGGTTLATSNSITVYRTPITPTSLTLQNATTTSITMRVAGGNYGVYQIKIAGGAYTQATAGGDVTFTGLSGGTSYSFTARRLNGTNPSAEITATASTLTPNLPIAPTVTANVGIVQNGFGLTTTSSGATNGTITYRWTSSDRVTHDTGYVASSTIGVGVEWEGTTWTVQAKASISGQSDVYSNTSSVVLPSYSISSGPPTIEEGSSGTFVHNVNNNILSTLYWQVTPTADFITSSGSISSTSSAGITVTPRSGDGAEGAESATLSLYINNTFNASNLVATRSFTITETSTTITTPGPPNVTHNNAELANVTATVTSGSTPGANGTLQFAQTTSNSIVGATWWQPGSTGSNFQHPRGTTRYYWARRSASNVSSSTAVTVSFLTSFDSSVTISPSTRQVTSTGNAADGQSATFTITNPSGSNTLFAKSVYRLVTTGGSWKKSKNGESDGAADITLLENDGDLPPDGTAATYTYQLSGKRRTDFGGPSNSGANFTDISGQSVTVERTVPGGNEAISASTMDEGASQAFTTANGKLSGLAANTTYYWKVFSPGNADFSTTQGDFTTDSSGATNGFTLATTSDSLTENAETAIIRIYTSSTDRNSDTGTGTNFEATASFTINDTSTSSSGGGDGDGGGGTASYGLIVKNANGTANIISPSQRAVGLIDYGIIGSGIPNQSDGVLTNLPEITADNGDEVYFFVSPASTNSPATQGAISYLNRGTGTIRIRNHSGAALPYNTPYYILRV